MKNREFFTCSLGEGQTIVLGVYVTPGTIPSGDNITSNLSKAMHQWVSQLPDNSTYKHRGLDVWDLLNLSHEEMVSFRQIAAQYGLTALTITDAWNTNGLRWVKVEPRALTV